MSEPPSSGPPLTSLADLDQSSPFNLAYQAWRQGDPLPLAAYIRENGIKSKWEADILAGIVTEGNRLKARGNSTEKAVHWLRMYAGIRSALKLSWGEVYRRVSSVTRKSPNTLKKIKEREGIQ